MDERKLEIWLLFQRDISEFYREKNVFIKYFFNLSPLKAVKFAQYIYSCALNVVYYSYFS